MKKWPSKQPKMLVNFLEFKFMNKIIKFFKDYPVSIVAIIAVVFFFIYAWPYFSLNNLASNAGMTIFNTPDETGNYFFAKLFAETGHLNYFEPLNLSSSWQLIHPRGTTVVAGNILPGGFLGFVILAGLFGKIFSTGAIILLVPAVSALAILAFYLLLAKIFSKRVSFFSALGLAVMPAFWYYSSRSLFNNIFFIDLLIIALAFLVYFVEQKKIWQILVFTGFWSLTLFVRPTEGLWLLFLVVLMFYFYRRKLSWKNLAWVIGGIVVSAGATLLLQKNLYGGYFATGYVPEVAKQGDASQMIINLLKQLFLPFGFDLRFLAYNFYHYFAKMFWWQFVLSALGALVIFWQWRIKKVSSVVSAYGLVAIIISLVVFIYYGSWFFFNNLTGLASIGSSQTRYLLPMYILTIPLMVYGLDFFLQKIKIKSVKVLSVSILAVIILVLNFQTAVVKGPESLLAIRSTMIHYYQINSEVKKITESDSVIVSSYSDKMFFPSRRVGFYWQDERFLTDWSRLASKTEIYFYDINSGKEIDYIKANSNLKAELVKLFDSKESLYRLSN